MLASLEICKQQLKCSDLKYEISGTVEVKETESLQDFIEQNEPLKAYLVGWESQGTAWATILVIGNSENGRFLVSRDPLPENTLKGRVILKGKCLSKTFGQIKNDLLCLETDC